MPLAKKGLAAILVSAVLLLLILFSVRLLINQDTVKNKIAARISRQLQADIRIGELSVSLLGPHIALKNAFITFKNNSQAHIPAGYVYPALLPLMRGAFIPKNIELDRPALRLRLPAFTEKPSAPDIRTFVQKQERALAALSERLKKLPAATLKINHGSCELFSRDRDRTLTISGIDLRIDTASDFARISLEATSPLWRTVRFKAQFSSAATLLSPEPSGSLEAAISQLDLTACRAALENMAGDFPGVQTITRRLQGGKATIDARVVLPLTGESLYAGQSRFTGNLDNITLSFPEAGLIIRNLSTGITLKEGMVQAEGLTARAGASRLDNATVVLDPARGFAPASLQADLRIDLAQVPKILPFVPSQRLRDELSRIQSPQGFISGACRLMRENNSYSLDVKSGTLKLIAQYRGFPLPILVQGGSCSFRKPQLTLTNLSGSVGRSRINHLSAGFSLAEDKNWWLHSTGGELDFKELHEILLSFSPTANALRKFLRASGRLQVSCLDLQGPINDPSQWRYELQGEVQNIALDYADLDGPFFCAGGSLDVSEKTVRLSEAKTAFLESALEGDIMVEDYVQGIGTFRAKAKGAIGRAFIETIYAGLKLPADLKPAAPAAVTRAEINWARGSETFFSADFIFNRSVKAGLSLRTQKSGFAIERLYARDKESNCSGRFGIQRNSLTLAYSGSLTKATLDRILAENKFLHGWVKGNFKAEFDTEDPHDSTADGNMQWEHIAFPGAGELPAVLNRASVSAQGGIITIQTAHISSATGTGKITGTVDFSGQDFHLDLNLTGDRFDIDTLLSRFKPAAAAQGPAGFWRIPLSGSVKVRTPELVLAGFTYSPCDFAMGFSDNLIRISTVNSSYCRIPVQAAVEITPETISIDAHPALHKASLEDVMKCITKEKSIMTGSLDAKGHLTAHAAPSQLAESFSGDFSIQARKGRIYRSNLLTKIVSFLSIRELLTGGILNFTEKGYDYETLRLKGSIEGRTARIREAVLVSSSMNLVCSGTIDFKTRQIELDALATPFQILDYVLSKVPLVGSVLKKTIIGVPLHIGGTIDDPRLTPRAPTSIGKDIVKIATDIIRLPIRIINPVREPR